MKMLKQEIKKRMPKQLYNLYELCWENSWIEKGYDQVKKYRIVRTQKNAKMRILFIVQRTEVFNSVRTIFEAAAASDQCETYLLPLPRCTQSQNELSWDTYASVVEFCRQLHSGTVIDTYDFETEKYFDLTQIMPDYIFLNVPYTQTYPSPYAIRNLALIAKVCYVPYAYSMLEKNFKYSYSMDLFINTRFIFAANKLGYQYCRNKVRFAELMNGKRVYNIGYPRFDLLHGSTGNSAKKTVLWLPRWTVNIGTQAANEQSSFLLYHTEFLNFAEKHPELDFVIRPHPLMFDNFMKYVVMSQEQKNDLLADIAARENVLLDNSPDYLDVLNKADILLADFTSIVAEFYTTARPVVYCGNGEAFSRFDQPMFETFYHAEEWADVEAHLTGLINGHDPKQEQREKAVSAFLFGNEGNAGARILNVLMDDFRKS